MEKFYLFKTRGGRIIPLDEFRAAAVGMNTAQGMEYLGMIETAKMEELAELTEVEQFGKGEERRPEADIQADYRKLEEKIREKNLPKPLPEVKRKHGVFGRSKEI